MGEHLVCNQGVGSSILPRSTTRFGKQGQRRTGGLVLGPSLPAQRNYVYVGNNTVGRPELRLRLGYAACHKNKGARNLPNRPFAISDCAFDYLARRRPTPSRSSRRYFGSRKISALVFLGRPRYGRMAIDNGISDLHAREAGKSIRCI